MRAFLQCCSLVFVIALLAACKSTGPKFDPYAPPAASATQNLAGFQPLESTNRIDPLWLKEPTDLFKLGPGDVIQVEIVGQPKSRASVSVGPDGKIYYSLLSATSVWGLTLGQTKSLLEESLGKYIRVKPELEISLVAAASKQIWVLGQVKAPGLYPLTMPLNVLGAVSAAKGTMAVLGSTEETVDLAHSFIMRDGQLLPVDLEALLRRGDLSQNIYLLPDDFLYFKPAVAKEIYVLGAVGQPSAVTYFASASVVSSIATVGGPVQYAYLSHVAVIRGSLNHPSIATVNYKALVHGDLPDVPLQAGDIVYVPYGPFRKLQQLGDQILAEFVRSIAINEGRNAVTKQGGAVPISVPLYQPTL
jgi:polysaccharide export outer membrane protein